MRFSRIHLALLFAAFVVSCGGDVGSSCTEAADCADNICLFDVDGNGVCTQRCDADEPCPDGFECVDLGGDVGDVCLEPGS